MDTPILNGAPPPPEVPQDVLDTLDEIKQRFITKQTPLLVAVTLDQQGNVGFTVLGGASPVIVLGMLEMAKALLPSMQTREQPRILSPHNAMRKPG